MNFEELILYTSDLNSTENFYRNTLELELINKSSSSISFKIGLTKLTFKYSNLNENAYNHFAINIPSNQINNALKWISQRCSPILNSDKEYITSFDNWKAKSIYFYDNNENILELIQRDDLNNPSNSDFDSNSFLTINEVGIATENPLLIYNQISSRINFPQFSKGPFRDDFIAQGFEDCLFVISSDKRNWYPTNKNARKNSIIVKIRINNSIETIKFNIKN